MISTSCSGCTNGFRFATKPKIMTIRNAVYTVMVLITCVAAKTAQASRCDCNQNMGSCIANVSVSGKWLKLRSSSEACSKIDYSINGDPKTRTITGGEETDEWLGRSPVKAISVDGCHICFDGMRNKHQASYPDQNRPVELNTDRLNDPKCAVGKDLTRLMDLSMNHPDAYAEFMKYCFH